MALDLSQAQNIKLDLRTISSEHKDIETLLKLNLNDWLKERNRVLLNFLIGISNAEVDIVNNKAAFKVGRVMEDIYRFPEDRHVCPSGYLQNLAIYN